MARTTTVRILGIEPLRRKLRAFRDEILARDFRTAMEEAAVAAEGSIRAGAPRGRSGQLRAQLSHKLQASPLPRYAVVKTSAVAQAPTGRLRVTAVSLRQAKGRKTFGKNRWRYPYSYPRRLEFERKGRHRGWMLRGLQRATGRIQAILGSAARRIEQRWGAA